MVFVMVEGVEQVVAEAVYRDELGVHGSVGKSTWKVGFLHTPVGT